MKPSRPALAALLLSTGLALGDPETNLRDLQTLQTPTLSAEELKQIAFTATIDTNDPRGPLQVELHNPFRDKSIRGVVVRVQSKGADGREQTLDAFVDLNCGPMQTSEIQAPLFHAEDLAKRSPVFTLKEVHREWPAEPETNPNDVKKPETPVLKTPTFSPEELKQILFSWHFNEQQSTPDLYFDLHNPFRDKLIRGIVLQVEYKSADGKPRTVELFDDLQCQPLGHAQHQLSVFSAVEIAKGSPAVTLKEVHRGE